MPVTIGAAESSFSNPIGLLVDCHRRIDRFLQILQTITSEKRGRSLNAEYRRALDTALKYFRDAAPKHTADEEEDLFPALRSLVGHAHVEQGGIEQVLRQIDRLENDHNLAAKWHRECDEIGRRWLRDDGLCLRDTARFEIVLSLLLRLYRSHIAIEEHEIFSTAQTALSDKEKAVIGHSMALRRGVPFTPEIVDQLIFTSAAGITGRSVDRSCNAVPAPSLEERQRFSAHRDRTAIEAPAVAPRREIII